MQVNESAASCLFSGQLQLKMHVVQKGGAAAAGKGRAARPGSAPAKPAGKPAAATAPGADAGTVARPPGRLGNEEDPIVLCDSDEDDAGEDVAQRAALISEALRQLNIVLRERWKLGRVPINTKLQSNVRAAGSLCHAAANYAWPAPVRCLCKAGSPAVLCSSHCVEHVPHAACRLRSRAPGPWRRSWRCKSTA
jgi:hypothetical protein